MALQTLTYSLGAGASDTHTLTRKGGEDTFNFNIDGADGTFSLILEGSSDDSTWDELYDSGTVSVIKDEKVSVGHVYIYTRCKITDKSSAPNTMTLYVTPFHIRVGELDDLIDVDVPTPSDNSILTYDASTGKWESRNDIEDLDYIDFDLTAAPTTQEGRLNWNDDDKTLEVGMAGGVSTLQVGQELYIRAKNASGDTIAHGTPVYISGADGINPEVGLADATVHLIANATIAVSTEQVLNNQFGYFTTYGIVRDIDTDFVAADGRPAFLSTTAGELSASLPTQPNSQVFVGVVLRKHATEGSMYVKIIPQPNTNELSDVLISGIADKQLLQWDGTDSRWENIDDVRMVSFTFPLRTVIDNQLNITGEFREVTSGETGDYTTDFAVSNNHIYLYINSLTGSGDVTITGTSLAETTAVPVTGDTETITVDTDTVYYQSDKKWWEVTNIDIPAGITGIDYDIGVLGYSDYQNNDFEMLGYRFDMFSQGNSADIKLLIYNVKSTTGKKFELITVENFGADSGSVGNQIVDGIRTGGDDRSYNPGVAQIWEDNTTLVLKQFDFSTYFTGDENIFIGSNAGGVIIRLEGCPSDGISNVDFATMQFYYKLV